MLLLCDNKSCSKPGDHKLDVETNEVICEFCGRPIKSITETMKRTLKSAGQVIKSNVKKAFMMGCQQCNANREIIYDKTTNKTVCKVCGAEVQVHAAMKQALIEMSKLEKDEEA